MQGYLLVRPVLANLNNSLQPQLVTHIQQCDDVEFIASAIPAFTTAVQHSISTLALSQV